MRYSGVHRLNEQIPRRVTAGIIRRRGITLHSTLDKTPVIVGRESGRLMK